MRVADGFRVRFKPGEDNLIDAFDYGYNFGCILQNKENKRAEKSGARQLVKCLVCGEIFDSSLEVCPVCGVGKENFVPVDAQESEFSNDTKDFYVILGNGTAGWNAAAEIRKRNKTASILMISNEPYRTYNRPMLTKSIMADLDEEQIAVQNAGWYEEQNIQQVLDMEVVAIHPETKEIELEGCLKFVYTKLIYALGSECFIPPIAGAEKKGVIAIRSLDDTKKVAAMLPDVEHVVQVTVLEAACQLMGRQLDDAAGEMLKHISEQQGVQIYTGVSIASIDGEDNVTGVTLADGRTFPAELVIVSAGVRANTVLAKKAGIEVDRAVIVNSKMETNVPDIYACGDCAQYDGLNYAIWPEASEQGKVAGANAAGEEMEYETVPAALSFHGMRTALFAAGDNGKNPNLVYKTIELKDMGKKQYQKYYFLNNRLCGVILIGDVSRMAEMTQALEEHVQYQELKL